MDAVPPTRSNPRLWPGEQPPPDDEECLMIFEYLDRKRGTPAHVFPDGSQAAKPQIFRNYLTMNLEAATENYNRGSDKPMSTQSLRTRLNKWHFPTKPGEKVEFVRSISAALQNYTASGAFELLDDTPKASFPIAIQPPEADTPSTNTDFSTPDTWPLEHHGPSVGYLGPRAENTSTSFVGQAPPMPPPNYPLRMHGANSSLGVKVDDLNSVDVRIEDGSVSVDADFRASKLSVQTDQTNDSGYYSKHGSVQSIASVNNLSLAPFLHQLPFPPVQDATMTEAASKGISDQRPPDSALREASYEDLHVEEETGRSAAKISVHHPHSGQWYGRLQTLPCDEFHTFLRWDKMTRVCGTCGFSKAHSLPTHGHKIDADSYHKEFRKMEREIFDAHLQNPPLLSDFAGNTPVLFAAAAGLSYGHLNGMVPIFGDEIYSANVWGQNFFHVLDPVHIGDKLSRLLREFESYKPGFIYERDVFGKTVLQCLLQNPLSPKVMKEVLLVFSQGPGGIYHQIHTLDRYGNDASWLPENLGKTNVILDTVDDIFQRQQVRGETNQMHFSRNLVHDIVSSDQPSPICKACGGDDYYSGDRFHQIECAIRAGAGDNDYNENGHTPLQVLVSTLRHEASKLSESCAITLLLVKKLLSCSASPHALLQARSREGKTALYMAAELGQTLVVEHLLNAIPERKRAMANVRTHDNVSVLSATIKAFHTADFNTDEEMMRQYRAIHILLIDAGGDLMSSDAYEWAL